MDQIKFILILPWISGLYTARNQDNRYDRALSTNMGAVVTSCDFNNHSYPYCHFRQDTEDNSDWTRHNGPSPTPGTGPDGDYPDGSGFYIYHECDNVANGQTARLISPSLSRGPAKMCVQFKYYMYGTDRQNKLAVLIKTPGMEENIWEKVGFQSPSWLGASVTVSIPEDQTVNMVFEATRGISSSCDTALDNIVISEGSCPGCISECDFDTWDGLCGWTLENDPGIFGWEQWTGSTPTEGTGPENDFSKPGFGLYMLLDSMSRVPGASAELWSPSVSSAGCLQLSFYYNMYGTSTNMQINVYGATTGANQEVPLLTLRGNQGQDWKKAETQYIGIAEVQFVIQGIYGETDKTDIAIDSVCITDCQVAALSTAEPSTEAPRPTTPKPLTSAPSTTPSPSTLQPPTTAPPVKCPPNAHYKECGPACIPSCQEPSTNCTGSCISGCFCDPGYVFRGRRCVPLHQCGCLDENNNYYEPGEIVFGDDCSRLCRCAGNYTLDCVSSACDPTEECREVNGVTGCYPKGSSTCIATSDPHYTTFDGRRYSFMGNCSYLMAETCNSSLAPPFSVYADNEHRFNRLSISYVKAVHVHTSGVVVSVLKGGIVQVNRTTVNLPVAPAQGVSVFRSGRHYTVAAVFGVTVRYDGNHFMDIKVTSDYKNSLCGLCGDYNGNQMDDFRTPSGQLVSNANDFGHSWNSDTNCNKKPNETMPECTDDQEATYESPAYCGMLLDSKGPFAICHPRVNPNGFFQDCLFDMCALDGAQTSLCEALESYVNECQDRNVSIGQWRNSTFCPLHCPADSHYEPCAPPCPPSCSIPSPEQCNGPCAEGCVCNAGYLYSSGKCVKRETCGCHFNGQYYQAGEEFYTEGCELKCKCDGGVVTCRSGECPPQHACGLQNGELGCYALSKKDCYISGDPHYTTFDGKYYTFMGTCTYTLARTCQNHTGPWFSVKGKNEERGVAGVSYLRELYITVSGVTVALTKSRRTLVNGLRVSLPHSPSPLIFLSLAGQYVTMQTPFGLTVRWDGNHYAHISVPSSYYDQMCGLCGNYDGNPNNDFTKPDGSLAGNSDQFGNSWQTEEDEGDMCLPDDKPDPPCDPSLEAEVSKLENCGKLNDTQGPFRDCIMVIDPQPYFLSCVYDMCRYDGLQQTLCDQLQSYTDACLSAGAPVHQWREPDFCPLACPPNSHYSLCVSPCPETCVAHSGVVQPGCGENCVEGCKCDPGFILSNDRCVPLKDCGCVDPQGSYHPVNESWYLKGCTQHCLCRGEGVIECHNTTCAPNQVCQLQDGEYSCQSLATPSPSTPQPPTTAPPVKCPPNAHYKECGPACIPSCQEPSTNCTGSCISGCFCDPGYVFRGRRCVPLHQCGCLDENNNYYEPGEIVFGDDCSRLCRCAGNYTLDCVSSACDPTEECREVNGVTGCYPKGSSTCIATSDPHYTTFDGRRYSFMGNCSYLMAETCNSSLAPPFSVYADNEHRFNRLSISYVKAVHVHTSGVVVSVLKGGIVQVNRTTVNLPVAPAQGVSVFRSGRHYTVAAVFGVTVRYDGNHFMDIKVTSDYKNSLCGLCGDYNGNQMDDFRTPSGQLVSNANDFGHSWNSDTNCNKKPNETMPECTDDQEATYESPAYCGMLLDSKGPFAICHPRVNPNGFFQDCLFDMCALDGAQTSLCEALESYVNECQDRNVSIGQWRNSTFCPLHCPADSHYEPCAPPCPPSCSIPSPEQCNGPCAEGCVCNAGYLYSSGKCVKGETCGCHFNGQYYQAGEEFYTEGCELKCKCDGGVVTCRSGECPPQHACGLQNGELGCYALSKKDCYISGDPHYTTFDGKYYTFMGTCTYTLARTCQNHTGPWFSVKGKNEERGVAGVSYLRELYITVSGVTVALTKSRRTLVNGLRVSLPHSPSPLIFLSLAGQYVTMQTPFGLTVRWDGNHHAHISVPSSYFDQMCGLCGNYDGNPNNDFTKPDGSLAGNSDQFGNSWQTEEDEGDMCLPDDKPDPPCDPSLEAEVSKLENCGKLNDTQGPFRDCIMVIDPRPYFLSCVYDMCRYDGLQQTLCDQLQSYTDACLSAGAPVHQWREPDFCPLACPPNSHYSLCVSPCPETCVAHSGVVQPGCGENCVEGCKCDPGFILSNDRCVPLKDCGCVDPQGSYHPVNESWYLKGCTQHCLCRGEGVIECHNTTCAPNQVCQLQDGEYSCQSLATPSPCTPQPPTTAPPVKCPPNAHYKECGPACIPSCQEPSTNCTGSCISGCFCDPGYVFRGRRCVPLHQCGCLDENNNYYEPGEIVFGDDCSRLCRCAGNYTLDCVSSACDPTEECREVNGVTGCYPKGSSTCIATSDPHYTTFDGRRYSFMGNCSYLMAETCNSSLAPPFSVYADNEHRFNRLSISYVKAVHVHTSGVVVSVLKGGIVQVNRTTVNLPVAPAQGVSVFRSGRHYTVAAVFGVTVRYDGNHFMDIKVTSDYKNSLCGLCGDYNGNQMDDFRTPSGQLVSNANDFGHSWNSDTNCNKKPNETMPECTDDQEATYESPAYCGMLLDSKGPFAICHPRVNPNGFFQDCLFDMCALDGAQTSLCEALESYVNECQDRNVSIGQWRNSTFCPLHCPADSHYEPCAPPCPPSCSIPSPEQCNAPCAEGCVCNAGYLYSSGKCVKRETCGCHFNGQYYQAGEEFYTEGCELKCKCDGGVVTCRSGECPPQHACGLQNGELGCYALSKKDCYISGDPHYTTFDGKYYTFMGTCTYTLARTCQNHTGPWFSVKGKNEERGVAGVSYLRELYITVSGVTVALTKSRRTLVNGLRVSLPHSPSPLIFLSLAGQYVTMQTPFGLTVRWDGNHYAHISVPSSYYDQMCGLCGNYDGNPNNDFTKPDGSLAGNSDQFGNSWQTEEDEGDMCLPDDKPDPPCDPSLEAEVSKLENCGKLNDTQGPFRDCIMVIDPRPYFLSCVYDMCRYDGLQQTLCDQLQSYTDACLSAGAPVHQWREPDFCPLACPPNSHYSLCVSPCPETCVAHSGVVQPGCGENCVEGCKCDPGFILSNDRCVPLKDCGCVDPQGSYHPVNESWYLKGCTQHCLCRGEGVIECHNTTCAPNQVCQLQDGEYSCQSLATPSPSTPQPPTTAPPVKCPPNAHYKECGPACIPSCQEPSTNCTGSCISGCFCDPGYVFRGRRCVPLHQCGCLDENNNYYEPGEIVFGDDCSRLCRCAGNYTLDCVSSACDPTEECREVNGVTGCYPKGSSTCIATSDPHYTTFDGRRYSFMGNCSYLMAETCNSSLAPPFSVYADNEHRFNRLSISYVKAVHVHTSGVVVSVLKGGIVQVNRTTVNLPVAPAQGVSVFRSGRHYTVAAVFGVTVRYDGNHFMDIKVTSDYKNSLCGLCGDYNGNQMDDFRTPSGQLVSNANDFGHSWNSDTNCNKKPNETMPECTDDQEATYESPAYCGMLLDSKGPFAICHPRVNPNGFFQDCLFDMCALDGAQTSLCEALESYVNECQDRNVSIGQWRNSTFCPLHCPADSHYEPCAPPCPPSCSIPSPEQCNGPCAEGCVCNVGYLYSSGKCVKRETCGCHFNGQYYQAGEEFYTEGCELKCKCDGGVVTCRSGECPPQHACGLQNGELGCYALSKKDCYISGDPHYTTFDGKYYTFMGTCTYTLARTCQNHTGPWFSVKGKNEERGVAGVSYLRELYITVSGVTVALTKSRRTLVNGLRVSLPHSPSPLIFLSLAGQYVTMQTPFGLTVRWDGNHYAHISVPSSYFDQMCGLCGNYDGNPNNDFTEPDGSLAGNSDQFGNSWQTEEDEGDMCLPDDKPDPPCDPSLEAEVSKLENCGKLNDTQGPFRDCIMVIDPQPYFLSCVYDMCRYGGLQQTLCDQLQSYTDACLSAGAPVHQWREPDFCPLACPPNSHYSLCVSPCPETCVAHSGVVQPGCGENCVEGCKCDPGFILSNDRCVPLKDCGCVDPQGSYHPVNESWYLKGCTQHCLCRGEGVIECHNTTCAPNQVCQLQDGEYSCQSLATPSPSTPQPPTTAPPVKCPPNAHYKECGPACIPSCQEPSTNCTGSCISGCFCDPGYVFRGRRCVPLHQCGCLDENNNYYEPGEIVFGDDCSRLCRCAGNYTLDCVSSACDPTEECREVNGVTGCYPKGSSTCIATSDPHYTTFDGRRYSFMGNCSYLMAETCNSSLAPPFSVYADNEHRFNRLSISYVKAVHVHTRGVVVSVLKGGIVQVNRTTVNLPVAPAQGVSVFRSGRHYTVAADFGVTVRYDGNHFMDIKVTSDYKNSLCGLCGDYNGNQMDDFRTPSGQLVSNANDFGHSWNSDTNCNKKPNETMPECTDDQEATYESPAYCGMLLDSKGPFAICHPRVNPNGFFQDCLFDMCALDGAQTSLCEALESYVNECQDRNVSIGQWRNSTFCPLHCPADSHYEPCAPPCPPSCSIPSPEQCNGPCAEGCVCNAGYLYSSGKCVKRETCGCHFNGQYYQAGEEFYTEGCELKCKCDGGVVTCRSGECPPQHACGLQNGELGCYALSKKDCYISGDPHYTTFDGKYYTFMGTCTYTLARTCQNHTGPWFSVKGKNEERGVAGVSYLRELYITVSGVTVALTKSRRTLVNGLRVSLPHSPSPLIFLSLAGQYVTMQTPFGLTVRWDGNHYAHISVPSSYFDQMCGLCGNYDGNPNNDFTKPDGSLAGNSDQFGNSWQTEEDEGDMCLPDDKPDPPCDPSLEAEVSKLENCGKLNDTQGPFRDCIMVIDPRPYFLSCVYDMCRYDGLQQTLCDQLQSYTDACLSAGAPVHQWREPDFCPLACPPNSHYSLCVSPCPETCVAHSGVVQPGCGENCVEGCKCDPGFILSNDRCVPLKDCGCVDPQGSYHPVNESWYLKGCTQHCLCRGEGVIECHNTTCAPNQVCQLQDGEYSCQSLATPSPSTPQPPTTAPPGRGTCSASGDPHYTSFDKKVHHFQGSCSYTLSKLCNFSSGLPYFSVDTQNEHRRNNKNVSYVRAVSVNVQGSVVILSKGRKVQVNGLRVHLPLSLPNGVTIHLSGTFVVLDAFFGLLVRYDGNHHVDVTLPSSYSGQLCGLCGNYNGKRSDDNLKPDGKPAANTNQFGESWQVTHNLPDCSHGGGVDECVEKVENEAQISCGMITDPNGIFKPCHTVVDPYIYFENCVYDQCGTQGDIVALCQAIQSYADLCALSGVPISWRNNTFCPLKCPVGSHYSHCGMACPTSCQDPGSTNSCNKPCVEGCVCDPGLVLSGDKCVPFSHCGCTDKDHNYHPVGDSWFPVADCSERCVCSSSYIITCEPWQCSPAQECGTEEGRLGCHSTGVGVCHVAGDPHYYTFDSKMHTFMGTCTYTLVEVCNSSRVVPFTVVAKNEERGQPEASYVSSVTVTLPAATVTLSKGRRVLLNGRRVRTPLAITAAGARVATSGVYSVLDTDFGLIVKFDGVHHLEITIPGDYFNKVCGMCGNYNNNSKDDNLMPNGHQAKDVIELGNSWKAEGDSDPDCQPDDREDLHPNCIAAEQSQFRTLCMELIMSNRFQPCHTLLHPKPFLDSCVYDMCEYDGMQATLCDNVEAYGQACQSLGTTISWRNRTFCPLPCPSNSHYSDCTAPCPASCADLFPISCPQTPNTCVEGCQCDAGFVLSDDRCVPLANCGCVDPSGEYHDVGDSWLNEHCNRQCSCTPGGILSCKPFECRHNSICFLDNKEGIRYCKPERFEKCSISGDPHYRTFDGFVHHYQGPHTYILTQSVNIPSSMEPLRVWGKNIRRGGNRRVSFLHEVYVDVFEINVRFLQRKIILVNGERVQPPLVPKEGLKITMNSRRMQLSTNFGLTVRFDGRSHAEVVLPSTYESVVRGLCGNYDGRRNNEYMKRDGTLTRNLNVFGDSWKVNDQQGPALRTTDLPAVARLHRREVEQEPDNGFETDGCTEMQLSELNSTRQCGALSDPAGPFKDCHSRLKPKVFQDDCVFDLCAMQSSPQLRCDSYEVFAQACQEQGITLGDWRLQLKCGLTCPANSTYKPCVSPCPASCGDLAAPSECTERFCMEGCQCNAGHVLSGTECVPYTQCGCTFQERYYLLNEKFVSEDCAQSCECTPTGVVCLSKSCPDTHVCTIYNMTRDCFKKSACLNSPCLNGGTCLDSSKDPGFTCQCAQGFQGLLCEEENNCPSCLDKNTKILIGVLVPLGVIILLLICICVYKQILRNKERLYIPDKLQMSKTKGPNYENEDSMDMKTKF